MFKLKDEVRLQYMKHCPIDGKSLGQTKVCPEHKKSKFTMNMKFRFTPEPVFVDPGMS